MRCQRGRAPDHAEVAINARLDGKRDQPPPDGSIGQVAQFTHRGSVDRPTRRPPRKAGDWARQRHSPLGLAASQRAPAAQLTYGRASVARSWSGRPSSAFASVRDTLEEGDAPVARQGHLRQGEAVDVAVQDGVRMGDHDDVAAAHPKTADHRVVGSASSHPSADRWRPWCGTRAAERYQDSW